MIGKLIRKTKEVGVGNLVLGCLKVFYYRSLQKRFGFDPWHTSPYELREYVQAVAAYINRHRPECVVDIGCGLGDLLAHIQAPKRIGVDPGKGEMEAARHLYGRQGIRFVRGSFDEFGEGMAIDYLITLNFMHGSPESIWKPAYTRICEKNQISHIIVDSYQTTEDTYRLDFDRILPENYEKGECLGVFLGDRHIYVYHRKTEPEGRISPKNR